MDTVPFRFYYCILRLLLSKLHEISAFVVVVVVGVGVFITGVVCAIGVILSAFFLLPVRSIPADLRTA